MQIAAADPNQMLTTEEAASLLGLKGATLANWREDGSQDLEFSKFGKSVRYRYGDVIAFMDRRRCTSTLEARRIKKAPQRAARTTSKTGVGASGSDHRRQPDLLDMVENERMR